MGFWGFAASLGTNKHPNNNKNCPAPWAANAGLGAFFNKPLRGGAFLGHYGGIPAPAPALIGPVGLLRASSFAAAARTRH